ALPARYLEVPRTLWHVLGLLIVYTTTTAGDRDTSCLSGVTNLSCHHHHTRHVRIERGIGCVIVGHSLVWHHPGILLPIRRELERHWNAVHRLPLTVCDHGSQIHIFKLLDFTGRSQLHVIVARGPGGLRKAQSSHESHKDQSKRAEP